MPLNNWFGIDPSVDLGAVTAYDFYHLEHFHPRGARAGRPHVKKNPDLDQAAPAPAMRPNSINWGLAEYDLPLLPVLGTQTGTAPAGRAPRGTLGWLVLSATTAMAVGVDALAVRGDHLMAVAGRRTRRVAAELADKPFWAWPGAVWRLWQGRRHEREP
jgi:hypothetical protein